MNSRESVLVYAVTAILAVLVAGAVLFGGDGNDAAAREDAANGAATSPDDLLDELIADEPDDDESGEEIDPAGGAGDEEPDAADDESQAVDEAAALRRLLGDFDVVDRGDGRKYRRVTVRRGDTLLGLLLRWTGTRELMPDVQALNEWTKRRELQPGDELLMPWVADGILLERARREGDGVASAPLRRGAPSTPPRGADQPEPEPLPRPGSGSDATPGGEVYVVKQGEALWSIAADRVGAAKADAYVREIVAANDSIIDGSRIHAGQEIVLP